MLLYFLLQIFGCSTLFTHTKKPVTPAVRLKWEEGESLQRQTRDNVQSSLNCPKEKDKFIKDQTFSTSINIQNIECYQHVNIIDCHFTNIEVKSEEKSIIYIKESGVFIYGSYFNKCFSVTRSDGILCHCIYFDSNTKGEINITNCNFTDNGNPNAIRSSTIQDTIIYSHKASILRIHDS